MARKRSIPKTIEAQQFVLRNKRGQARAVLAIHDGAPAFKLLDLQGLPRVMIWLDRFEGTLVRIEAERGAYVGLSSDDQGSVGLGISRQGGVPTFSIGGHPPSREDMLRVVVYDTEGNPESWYYRYGPAHRDPPLAASDSDK